MSFQPVNFFRNHYKKLLIFIVSMVFVIAAGVYYVNLSAGSGERKIEFTVKNGWGAHAVTSQLYKNRMIKSRTFFKLILRFRGKSGSIKKGIYVLNDGLSINRIIDIITSGRTKTFSFTIPEGYNNRQIADFFVKKGIFKTQKEFFKISSSREILRKFKIPGKDTEGYLFPDTYTFPIGYSKIKIIEHMVKTFIEKSSSLNGFPKDSVRRHKLVILASIVEKEAKLKEERPLIAGVFANRLKRNYPLESCATIQYLFKKPKKRIYYQYLKIESAYNTYIHNGLPPGPISNPGLPAIKAALNPEKTDYLFFVVRGDGSHHFSKSFNEHARAKGKFLGR